LRMSTETAHSDKAGNTDDFCNRIAKSVALDLQYNFNIQTGDLSVQCRTSQGKKTLYCVIIRSTYLSSDAHLTTMTFSRVNIVFSDISESNDAPMIVLSSKPLRAPAP